VQNRRKYRNRKGIAAAPGASICGQLVIAHFA
jgi:hypothetical protein